MKKKKHAEKQVLPDKIKWDKITLLLFAAIIALLLFLRFYNLETNPLWYGDECEDTDTAWFMIHGHPQIRAIIDTSIAPYKARPPLFYLLGGLSQIIMGKGVYSMRIFTAFLSLLTGIILFLLGKTLFNTKTGLTALFLFAIYPVLIIHNRWAFSHNLSMFMNITIFFLAVKYIQEKKDKWFYLLCSSVSISMVSNYFNAVLFPFLLLIIFMVDRKKIWIGSLIAISLPVLFVSSMTIVTGKIFIEDMKNLFNFVKPGSRYEHKLAAADAPFYYKIAVNYYNFIKMDIFMLFGFLGLFIKPGLSIFPDNTNTNITSFKKFLYNNKDRMLLPMIFFLLSIEIFRERTNIPWFSYPALIFFPFLILGLALFLNKAAEIAAKLISPVMGFSKEKSVFYFSNVLLLVALVPFSKNLPGNIQSTANMFKTPIDNFCVQSSSNAVKLAEFINKNTVKNDFIICMPNISWLLTCQTADLLQTVAIEGTECFHYPANMPKNRFYFDCHYNKAKLIIMDQITRIWGIYNTGCIEKLDIMEKERWQLVYQLGEYSVFSNPNYPNQTLKGQPALIINNPGIYNKLGADAFNKKMFNDAADEFQKALIINPGIAEINLNLAITFFNLGKKDMARKYLNEVLRLDPQNKNAISLSGIIGK